MNRVCVTGGGGFIGSNLADALSATGVQVVVVDDFRTGHREFLESFLANPDNRLVRGDILNQSVLVDAMEGCDWVFHLARETPTCGMGSTTRPAILNRTPLRPPGCSKR